MSLYQDFLRLRRSARVNDFFSDVSDLDDLNLHIEGNYRLVVRVIYHNLDFTDSCPIDTKFTLNRIYNAILLYLQRLISAERMRCFVTVQLLLETSDLFRSRVIMEDSSLCAFPQSK